MSVETAFVLGFLVGGVVGVGLTVHAFLRKRVEITANE
jgi:hypothetical protein